MDEETYIEKKINCPSCKNGIEFAIKLKNIKVSEIKLKTRCSSCGNEILITPSSIIGIMNLNENIEREKLEEIDIIEKDNIDEIDIPNDINSFFEDVEEKISDDYKEVEDNRKTREYINDIFS
jgi:hypothetical protein